MQPSPISLTASLILESWVKANLSPTQDEDAPRPAHLAHQDIATDVECAQREDDPLAQRVLLSISLTPKAKSRYNYDFRIEMMGFFRLAPDWPEEQRSSLVAINGPSLLYSAAREHLAQITARGPFPSLFLPSITFMPARKLSAEQAAAVSEGTPPPKAKRTRKQKV